MVEGMRVRRRCALGVADRISWLGSVRRGEGRQVPLSGRKQRDERTDRSGSKQGGGGRGNDKDGGHEWAGGRGKRAVHGGGGGGEERRDNRRH